jgi:ribosomal protein L29
MASAQEYRNMSEKDLNAELINLRREQFNLRMQDQIKKPANTSEAQKGDS